MIGDALLDRGTCKDLHETVAVSVELHLLVTTPTVNFRRPLYFQIRPLLTGPQYWMLSDWSPSSHW
jgi:hypothetical protein